MEWDFLKMIGWVLLALLGMWFSCGSLVSNIKAFIDLWRGK
jgi:hypothetical protein